MKWLKYTYLLIILAGCTLGQQRSLEPISEQDVPLSVEDFPLGWYYASSQTTGHDGWGKASYYVINFTTRSPHYLNALVFLLRYENVGSAQLAFDRHESGVFYTRPGYSDDYWVIPPKLDPNVQLANEYKLGCIRDKTCTFFAQYESCVIWFSSQMQDPLMTYTDFADIVENIIDTRMSDVIICHSD
jgi:hypothetical protein